MPAEKLSMKKIKEVLSLPYAGLGYRVINNSTGIGLGSVSHYIKRAKACGLTWPLPADLNDEMLQECLFPVNQESLKAGICLVPCMLYLKNKELNIYCILIAAILFAIFKILNKLTGFKLALLAFTLELDKAIIKDIVIFSGGNPDLVGLRL